MIPCWLSVSLIVVTFLIPIFVYNEWNNERVTSILVAVLIAVVVLGWGVLGNVVEVCSRPGPSFRARVLKDDAAIFITYDSTIIRTFRDIKTYKELHELEFVNINTQDSVNMYNSVIERKYTIVLDTPAKYE